MLITMNGRVIHFSAGSGGGGLMKIAGGVEPKRLSAQKPPTVPPKPRQQKKPAFTLKASEIYKARKMAAQPGQAEETERSRACGMLDASDVYARRKAV